VGARPFAIPLVTMNEKGGFAAGGVPKAWIAPSAGSPSVGEQGGQAVTSEAKRCYDESPLEVVRAD